MSAPERPVVWVVGAHGLLGSAVVRQLRRSSSQVVTTAVPWQNPAAAVDTLAEACGRVLRQSGAWRVLWCAGAGVIGTSEQDLRQELDVLGGFLGRFAAQVSTEPGSAVRGALVLASSGGGVYAGSTGAPFTEATAPRPTSPYGETKLAAEGLVEQFGADTGVPTLVGRIANLYGPGQDVMKPQGLVSQLCLNHLTRRPSSIYVSLDTARDYLYVDDCARMLLQGVELAAASGGQTRKVMASEHSVTVGAILGELRRVTRRRPQVVSAVSPLTRFQTMDLRFASRVWPELRSEARTSLGEGMRKTLDALGLDLQAGRLGR